MELQVPREKMYSLAVRKRTDAADFFWNKEDFAFHELKIDCQNRYWLADPFLFENGGKVFVFYEAFDLIQRKGKIGYSIIDGTTRKKSVHIVLEEPYHLSFPYIFLYDGCVYMMPETCEDFTIKLYKAIEFPHKWVEEKILLSDVFACDSVIATNKIGERMLIASEMYRDKTPNDNYISCWVKNVCYNLNEHLEIVGEGSLVAEGDCGIRNAGNIFSVDENLYRVGQNCPDKLYGKGLVMFKIHSLNPYREEMLWIKNCEEFDRHIIKDCNEKIIGVHTYNFSEHYEVIDFSQIRDWNLSTYMKKKRKDLYTNVRSIPWRIKNKIRQYIYRNK